MKRTHTKVATMKLAFHNNVNFHGMHIPKFAIYGKNPQEIDFIIIDKTYTHGLTVYLWDDTMCEFIRTYSTEADRWYIQGMLSQKFHSRNFEDSCFDGMNWASLPVQRDRRNKEAERVASSLAMSPIDLTTIKRQTKKSCHALKKGGAYAARQRDKELNGRTVRLDMWETYAICRGVC